MSDSDRLKSDRIEAALEEALAGGSTRVLFELLDRASGMPGPRPRIEVLTAFGARIASLGAPGRELEEALFAAGKASLFYVAIMSLAARASKKGEKTALKALVDLGDETVKERRDAVIEGLALALAARGDEAARLVAPHADGYLHAFVALEALTKNRVLEKLSEAASVLDLLGDAFLRADEAPRSSDRTQGLRLLRQGFPAQIARAAVRFPEAVDFLRERAAWQRPDTREVIAETIDKLRKVLGEAEADRLRGALNDSAPVPRYAARIVQGTRKRSRGR